jgi:cytochrome c oxidase subunit II
MMPPAPRAAYRSGWSSVVRLSAVFAAVVCLTTGCRMRGVQHVLDPAGPLAAQIAWLWWLYFWICTAVFVIVMAFLVHAILVARRQETIDEEGSNRKATPWVIGGTVATLMILIVMLFASVIVGRRTALMPERDPLIIEVTGHRWWWQVRYLEGTPSRTLDTANEIHIPVGRAVQLHLRSSDVIHSFWVPNLHGKTDMVPGRPATSWIMADRPGVWRGQCAEFCGLQHAHMAFVVVALPAAEFDRWYDQQILPAREPVTPIEVRGREVFNTSSCALCHTIRGTGAGARVAPDLTHFGSRRSIAAATLPNTAGHLGGWLVDPQAAKPGNFMPATELAPDDLQALITYLRSLR